VLSGANFADFQWLFLDGALVIFFTWSMSFNIAAPTLSKYRPDCSLLTKRIALIVFGQATVFIAFSSLAFFLLTRSEFFERWRPIEIGLPKGVFHFYGDNYEGELMFLILATFLIFSGIALSFGHHHRSPIYWNKPLIATSFIAVALVVRVISADHTGLNCLFRINCDSRTAITKTVPVLSSFSVSGGECFYGPQLTHWVDNAANITASQRIPLQKMVSEALEDPKKTGCRPEDSVVKQMSIPKEYIEPEAINNIYPFYFRKLLLGLLASCGAVLLLWQYFIVQHPCYDI
jgi:hypothetical protein